MKCARRNAVAGGGAAAARSSPPRPTAAPMLVSCGTGFSLVELIVVIVIVAILAAIAIPRFSRAKEAAGPAASQHDLSILQSQIELYRLDHEAYPGYATDGTNPAHSAAAFVSQMTTYSDRAGNASGTVGSGTPYGPYLRKGIPALKYGPKAGKNGVKLVTGSTTLSFAPTDDVGWLYNDTTGEIAPNAPDTVGSTEVGVTPGGTETAGGDAIPDGIP
jgi:general secretion pathway protein G